MRRLTLGVEDFADLATEVLRGGGAFCFEAKGDSMRPFIRHGDVLEVRPVDPADLRRGDVALYLRAGERPVAHRVVGRTAGAAPGAIYTRADGVLEPSESVRAEDILGRVVSLTRGPRSIPIASPGWRAAALLWHLFRPPGVCLMRMRGRAKQRLRRTPDAPETGAPPLLPTDLTAEQRLAIHCCRTHLDDTSRARLGELLAEGIDAGELLRIAACHRILPLIYVTLRDSDLQDGLDERFRTHLKALFHTHAQRSPAQVTALLQVLNALAGKGITALPFKGATLAALAYHDIALRPYDDHDILIEPHALAQARDVLEQLGYTPGSSRRGIADSALLCYQSQLGFTRPEPRAVVELHWRPVSSYLWVPGQALALADATRSTELGGERVTTFAPEALLVIACLHGLGHGWERLIWVCDVARLPQLDPDWDAVAAHARELRCGRALALGFRLAGDLLGEDLPAEAQSLVERWTVPDHAVRQIVGRLFAPRKSGLPGLAGAIEDARARDSVADGLRAMAYRLTRPAASDLGALGERCPLWLAPVARALRVLRRRSG